MLNWMNPADTERGGFPVNVRGARRGIFRRKARAIGARENLLREGRSMTTHPRTRPGRPLAVWLAAAGAALAGAAPAGAQAPAADARVFVTVNGGLQTLTGGFSENVAFPATAGEYGTVLSSAAAGEQARFESDYRFGNAPLLDVSGGMRVAPRIALGVGVSRFRTRERAGVSAWAPHPFFFGRDRSFSGDSPLLTRRETAVHLQALVVAPVGGSFTVTAFGGPTFFTAVEQQLVTDVNFAHEYPYDSASFLGVVTDRGAESTDTAFGFHVGADVVYWFTGNLGVGWLTRYSRATARVPSGGGEIDVRAGGLHAAGGLRVRF